MTDSKAHLNRKRELALIQGHSQVILKRHRGNRRLWQIGFCKQVSLELFTEGDRGKDFKKRGK